MTVSPARLQELSDRAEITDLIGRYTTGMDMRDWALYRSVWVDRISPPLFARAADKGGLDSILTDHWVEALKCFFDEIVASQHLKVPVRWELTGDDATVLSICQGKHYLPNAHGGSIASTIGYYRDTFARIDGTWKTIEVSELTFWYEGNSFVVQEGRARLMAKLAERYPSVDWESALRGNLVTDG